MHYTSVNCGLNMENRCTRDLNTADIAAPLQLSASTPQGFFKIGKMYSTMQVFEAFLVKGFCRKADFFIKCL